MAVMLEARNIVKSFGDLIANNHINIKLEAGKIHCLLGENGAGKTTLMNILYGLYQMDEGQIYIRGQEVRFHSPADAIKKGIGMVSQQYSLVPRLTVSENIVMGDIPTKRFFVIDKDVSRDSVARLEKSCGFKIDVDAKVQDLSAGEQQRVEIIKAIYRGAKILILDEPTAVLTSQEVNDLFRILRTMTDEGQAIIFITHKLDEALNCDQITVIRAGEVVFNKNTNSTNKDELCESMFGRTVFIQEYKLPITKESPVALEVRDVYAKSHRRLSELKDISFKIREGQILGIAGIAGNGQAELVEVVTGLREVTKGSVLLKGVDITNCSPVLCKEQQMAHISDNVRKTGSFADLSISENLISGREHKPPFADGFRLVFSAINSFAKKMVTTFDIKTVSTETLAKQLSGGNLQKVVLARELAWEPEFIVAANPTRGLDAKTTEIVHQKLLEQRERGKAVLLISQDLTELLNLSDSVGVMYEGKLMLIPPDQGKRDRIEKMMVGL
ncbi:ABC transporter ATP-binding protein [Chloroflexota bacterium]